MNAKDPPSKVSKPNAIVMLPEKQDVRQLHLLMTRARSPHVLVLSRENCSPVSRWAAPEGIIPVSLSISEKSSILFSRLVV